MTGGAGYKGCVLVPKLLAADYDVVVYDRMYFGSDGLPEHSDLRVIDADIRDITTFSEAVRKCDAVIHMACISNDPSYELDPDLSRTINFDCFEPLVVASKRAGVQRFINISSSSVYGVSDAPEVTEEHPLNPLTDYSKYKGMCESVLFEHGSPDFVPVNLRPATVCGYSPRMRFDLTVNILTNLAVNRGKITVFGGAQKRPNIHIDDITELYIKMLDFPEDQVAFKTFNVGYENDTVARLAEIVKSVVEREFPDKPPISIETTPTDDNRSYHVSSRKIDQELGYRPCRTIEDAVRDLCCAFRAGKFPDSLTNEAYTNVKTMKKLGFR